jgi:hypothetical protein
MSKPKSVDFASELRANADPNAPLAALPIENNPPTPQVPEAPDTEKAYSAEELLGEAQDQPELLIETQFGKMTPSQYAAKMEAIEAQRASWQSAADSANARLRALESKLDSQPAHPQPTPLVQDKPLVKPVIADFTKGIEQDDVPGMLDAQAKYFEALNQYNIEQTTRTMREEFRTVREQDEVLNRAKALAKQDERFRNQDGSPNLNAIHAYLNQRVDNWEQLYANERDAAAYRQMVEEQARIEESNRANGYPSSVSASRPSYPKTIASSGSGSNPAGNAAKRKPPEWVTSLQRGYGSKFSLPPGAKIVTN